MPYFCWSTSGSIKYLQVGFRVKIQLHNLKLYTQARKLNIINRAVHDISLFRLLYLSTSIVQCLEISRVQNLEISRLCTLEISRRCTVEIERQSRRNKLLCNLFTLRNKLLCNLFTLHTSENR